MHSEGYEGFTLIETLLVLAITLAILGFSLHSYTHFITKKQLRAASDELYGYLKQAQAQSIQEHNTVYVSFHPSKDWCYGLDDRRPCLCHIKHHCQMQGLEMVVHHTTYPQLLLTLSGFSGSTTNPYVEFNGKRGTIHTTGRLHFSVDKDSTTLSTNTMGLITQCSNTLLGLPLCPLAS